jgi:hypothetical protein
MANVTYIKPVSDGRLRTVLQRIANLLGKDIRVHSGDRPTNHYVKGSSNKSLHVAQRAADFHIAGMSDTQGYAFFKANMNKIFDQTEAWEVIQHRPGGQTEGPHLHIGRYGNGRSGYIKFKVDGLEFGKHYYVTTVEFTSPTGVPVKVEETQVSALIAGSNGSPTNILESVGKYGKNHPNDVWFIQFLLNLARIKLVEANINFQKYNQIVENGNCGEDTIQAITIFQRDVIGWNDPDGRVDPGGRTLQILFIAAYNPSDATLRRVNRAKVLLPETNDQSWNGILAWGSFRNANITPSFISKTIRISHELGIKNPGWLMTVMAFETGRTFSPSEPNRAGSSGTGLVQFMKATIDGYTDKNTGKFHSGIGPKLGITHSQLAGMTAERQLDVVKVYFQQFGSRPSQAQDVDDLYFLVLRPASFGKSDDATVFQPGTDAYRKNSGLDTNRDGRVDVAETARTIREMFREGMGRYGLRMK